MGHLSHSLSNRPEAALGPVVRKTMPLIRHENKKNRAARETIVHRRKQEQNVSRRENGMCGRPIIE